jgi:hypothetical protein
MLTQSDSAHRRENAKERRRKKFKLLVRKRLCNATKNKQNAEQDHGEKYSEHFCPRGEY